MVILVRKNQLKTMRILFWVLNIERQKKTVGVQYTSQMFDISLNSMPDIVIVFVSYLFMQQSQILGTKKNKVFFMVGLWLD